MFDDFSIKTDRAFEENIETLATPKKVMRVLRSPALIKEREYFTSMIDGITELHGFLQTISNPSEAVDALNVINTSSDPTGHGI